MRSKKLKMGNAKYSINKTTQERCFVVKHLEEKVDRLGMPIKKEKAMKTKARRGQTVRQNDNEKRRI